MNEDVKTLFAKASEAIRRDLNHIFGEASLGKLSATSSRDLVAYTKLLGDMLDQEQEADDELDGKSPEELKALAKALIDENPPKP